MTRVLITIDTELSAALYQAGRSADANFASSILGRCAAGDFGVVRQMETLGRHGLKAVFFVDPLPALVYGPDVIRRIVDPILAGGHEVQLHIHTEWLAWAKDDPVAGRRGRNIGDFGEADQCTLIALARDLLVAAGAPAPIAFRAGNYGADDATLRALAALGLRYDSSFNPAYIGDPCRIGLPPAQAAAVEREGVLEIPVSAIFATPGRLRHAQLCALSAWEMRAALAYAGATGQPLFTIVSHSFELLSRDRLRPNRTVIARFERLCRALAEDRRLATAGFADLGDLGPAPAHDRLAPNRLRTALRIGGQAIATLRYERA